MRMTKKVVSLILAVMMVATMMSVMAISASAATTITTAAEFDAAIQSSGEYVLGADINLADISMSYSTVPAGADVTIDFADYTLTAYYGIENDGTLTLKASGNGGIAATGMAIDNFGDLTVESGTYSSTKSGFATIHSEEGCNTLVKGGTFSSNAYGIYIYKNSATTINGGTFTSAGWVICTWSQTNNATITITKGTFTSTGNAVFSGNGTSGAGNNTWTISGGTFNANTPGVEDVACAIYAPNDDTWTISGGTFNVTNGVGVCQRAGAVEIKGGTFNVTGDGTLGTVGDSRVVIPTGSAIVYDSKANYPAQSSDDATAVSGGTFNTEQDPIAMVKADDSDADRVTVTGGTFSGDASAYVDDADLVSEYTDVNGKTQYSKSFLMGSCNNGTYKLLKDVTSTTWIATAVFGSDVVIDLNGHTFTTSASRGYAVSLGRNGSAASPKKMTIKNGTINYTNADSNYAAIQYQGKYNELILDNVTINSAVAGVAMLSENQTLAINNSTINATDDFALATNGASTKNGKITVTGSELNSNSVAVYLPGDADVTFTNTDVTGSTAVYVKGGSVEINGGTYKAIGAAAAYTYNGSGCNSTGDAIVVENAGSSYTAGPADVAIKGGNFESANGAAVSTPVKDDSLDAAEGFIYGGTYDGDVNNDYVAPGLVDVAGTGGKFVIELDTNPIKDNTMIKGFQEKISEPAVRIWTSVDRDFLETYADEYGYVVARYSGDKEQDELDFSKMMAYGGNGEKTIDCTGTYNVGVGHDTEDDVTLAVTGMEDGNKVVARFYVIIDGVTYYAKCATVYDGILATYTA